ncbi:MAG: hypothetical protein JWR19_1598 [Pedosphaera sp.]|nr:hypothetical protein [Pedosphaera sp.]
MNRAQAKLKRRLLELTVELAQTRKLLAREITDRKQSERAWHASEHRFMAFMENSPAMSYIKDDKGCYLYANKRWESFYSARLVPGKERNDFLLYPPHTARQIQNEDLKILATGTCQETVRDHAIGNGSLSSWLFIQFPILDPRGRPFIGGVAVDITERRERESQILEISEREQQRIGQDLHDELCQHLTGIKFKSGLLKKRLEQRSSREALRAGAIEDMVNVAIDRARRLARGLYPVQLESQGLSSALEELTSSMAAVHRRACQCKIPRPVLIHDNAVAVHLYRIAQEAIMNAIKHGRARRIIVGLVAKGGQIVLSVKDNGVGLPQKIPAAKGMGLHIMKYRARTVGATLNLTSNSRSGTLLTCSLPCSES